MGCLLKGFDIASIALRESECIVTDWMGPLVMASLMASSSVVKDDTMGWIRRVCYVLGHVKA